MGFCVCASDGSAAALSVNGTHDIFNAGQVDGLSSNGVAVYGSGTIVNTGVISSNFAIADLDTNANDTNYVYNYGTVSGRAYSINGGSDLGNASITASMPMLGNRKLPCSYRVRKNAEPGRDARMSVRARWNG